MKTFIFPPSVIVQKFTFYKVSTLLALKYLNGLRTQDQRLPRWSEDNDASKEKAQKPQDLMIKEVKLTNAVLKAGYCETIMFQQRE